MVGRGLRFAALGTVVTTLLAMAFLQQDWARARLVLQGAQIGWLLLGMASTTLGLVFLAARWRSLMPVRTGVTLGPLTAILTSATLLNYALPGPVGEFAAAAMAGKRYGMLPELAFAANVHARFVGLALAGSAGLLLFLLGDVPSPPGYESAVGFAAAAIAAGALVLFALSARPGALRAVADAILGWWPGGWRDALRARVAHLGDALAAVGGLGLARYAQAAFWALCGHACVTFGLYLMAVGFGETPHVGGLTFTYAITTAGAVVLFAFPGSQVGWDAMLSSLLVMSAGLSAEVALAVAVVSRLQQFVIVVIGAIALFGQGGR